MQRLRPRIPISLAVDCGWRHGGFAQSAPGIRSKCCTANEKPAAVNQERQKKTPRDQNEHLTPGELKGCMLLDGPHSHSFLIRLRGGVLTRFPPSRSSPGQCVPPDKG